MGSKGNVRLRRHKGRVKATPRSESVSNVDRASVASFGDEWSRFDQAPVDPRELNRIFDQYFRIFPWGQLPPDAEGFDMGCGSGRWAKMVAPRVGYLNCVDPSDGALTVAKRNLSAYQNVRFLNASANDVPLAKTSQDFGYSLGVLHHIPDTESALRACVELLKPGAPFLVYLYYRFDNRPPWFPMVWRMSELLRRGISRSPGWTKHFVTDAIALTVYWPFARLGLLSERLGLGMTNLPLYGYRNYSFYTMRTDSRDRFGTPLEQRFTRDEIRDMMTRTGLRNIVFSEEEPYWCALGFRER